MRSMAPPHQAGKCGQYASSMPVTTFDPVRDVDGRACDSAQRALGCRDWLWRASVFAHEVDELFGRVWLA
jgi:hypothetical protein